MVLGRTMHMQGARYPVGLMEGREALSAMTNTPQTHPSLPFEPTPSLPAPRPRAHPDPRLVTSQYVHHKEKGITWLHTLAPNSPLESLGFPTHHLPPPTTTQKCSVWQPSNPTATSSIANPAWHLRTPLAGFAAVVQIHAVDCGCCPRGVRVRRCGVRRCFAGDEQLGVEASCCSAANPTGDCAPRTWQTPQSGVFVCEHVADMRLPVCGGVTASARQQAVVGAPGVALALES
jgi:hypothetical protein